MSIVRRSIYAGVSCWKNRVLLFVKRVLHIVAACCAEAEFAIQANERVEYVVVDARTQSGTCCTASGAADKPTNDSAGNTA